jgi:type 1 glutamine amidotransferase
MALRALKLTLLCVFVSAALLLFTPFGYAQVTEQQRVWSEEMFRGMLLDGHTQYLPRVPFPDLAIGSKLSGEPALLSKIDVPKMVRQLKQANIQYVYFDAKTRGGLFYNSKLYPQYKHWALGDFDFFGEFVKECRKVGILPFGYVSMPDIPSDQSRVEKDFPDWRQSTTECGNPYRKFYLAILGEITSRYDIAGYWLDGFRGYTCDCNYCRVKFKKETGHEMPDKPSGPQTPELRAWYSREYDRFCQEVREVIHAARPGTMVARNFSGPVPLPIGQHRGTAGFGEAQLANPERGDPETNADTQDFISSEVNGGNMMASVWPRFLRALGGGNKITEMEVWRFNYPCPGGTYNVKPVPWLLAEMTSVIANGGKIQLYDNMYPDGTLEPQMIENVGTAYREIEKREPWLRRAEPVRFAAVCWSKHARAVPATVGTSTTPIPITNALGRRAASTSTPSPVLGVSHALMRSQISFEGITNRGITSDYLRQFKVVVLPDINFMARAEAEAIRQYVSNGGGLVALFESSLYNQSGERQKDFQLADVFGVSYQGRAETLNTFLKLTGEHPVTAGIAKTMPLASQNILQLQVKALPAAEALGRLLLSYRNGFGWPPSSEETGFVGPVVNRYGKGRVVYFPGDVGTIYYNFGQPEYRRMLANAVLWAANAEPPIVVEAPTSVEVTIFKQEREKRLVTHLVNLQSQTGHAFAFTPVSNGHAGAYIEDVLPVYDIKVKVRVPKGARVKAVYLAPEREAAKYRREGDYLLLTVPKVYIHRMVVVELAD